MTSFREQAEWTAEQALAYIVNLQGADETSQFDAFATAYNYFMNLSKKKISWSVHLERLAYEFIELAFDNNKHSSIKDVLKSYRAATQGQYSESLKDVLEHYRDRKLQAILEEDILYENIDFIRDMSNIQIEEPSSTMIFESLRPAEKKKLQELRHKLRIVWDGYKYIIETVRINQKLQEVFKQTLNKVFIFVQKFNRKHQFKSFCRTLRSGLLNAFSKRDRTEQQRAIYIDIEKADVNDRHIEIRLDQFKVTIKLGLWQQAFQVLEDINNLMKVRKGALKTNIRYKYFDNLALLFKKSNYWHYHAFAFYNKFLAAQKNPKLTMGEKVQLSDLLLLSVLCIPPVTLQSHQSKDSQNKISSMMISSTKIPNKQELFDIIVSAGISEYASTQIRNLWSFMFLEFDLESLSKGLQLLSKITKDQYSEFKTLVQDILIYKQLQSISEIYQRIKIDSLLSLIPLPKQKIERILLSSYHQKILDFVLDEDQKIVVFQDKSQERLISPTQNFFDVYIDLAVEKEKQREEDGKYIVKKLQDFVKTSQEYYWKIRQYKIEEYKKKLKKPKQQLLNEAHRRKAQQKQQRERAEFEKTIRQTQALKLAEQKKKEFGTKKIIINDIKQIKQQRVVRVLGQKVQQLTDEQIQNISLQTLTDTLQQIKAKIQNNREARFKKVFNQIDYVERQRRQKLDEKLKATLPSKEDELQQFQQIRRDSKIHYQEQKSMKDKVAKMMNYLKPKIENQTKKMEEQYDHDMIVFKERLTNYYKERIIAKAKALAKQNKEKKEADEQLMRNAQSDGFNNTKWTFSGFSRVSGTQPIPSAQKPQTTQPMIKIGGKKLQDKPSTQQNPQQTRPWGRKKEQQKKEQPTQPGQKWGRKQRQQPQVKKQQPVKTNTFAPPPPTQKKTMGIGLGLGLGLGKKKEQPKKEQPKKQQPKKEQPKKDDGKPRPAKKYVNVN